VRNSLLSEALVFSSDLYMYFLLCCSELQMSNGILSAALVFSNDICLLMRILKLQMRGGVLSSALVFSNCIYMYFLMCSADQQALYFIFAC